jgi:hypothetical protein
MCMIYVLYLQAQFMGCVYAYTILLTFLGPEYLGRDFHVESDEDMAAAATPDAMGVLRQTGHESSDDGKDVQAMTADEKV